MFRDQGITVDWKYKNGKGECLDLGFMPGDNPEPDGVKPKGKEAEFGGAFGKYAPKNMTPMMAATEWLKGVKSRPNEKAIIGLWDVTSETPRLVFTEDPNPRCDCKGYDPKKSGLGTYIVNGGKNSPVLSFQPKVKWPFQAAGPGGGNVASPHSGTVDHMSDVPQPGCKGLVKVGGKGGAHGNPIPNETLTLQSGKNANQDAIESVHRYTRAYQVHNSITCQLTIQGDPSFFSPLFLVGRTFSIIVINPYHYNSKGSSSDTTCGEWLAQPVINSTFSNRSWFIQGCTHQIKEGSYQTLFDLFLPAPGIDISPDLPVGCKDSGGETVS